MKQTVYFGAVVSDFSSESAHADVNGLMPVVLTPIFGQAPRGRVVLSGTIATSDSMQLETGKIYYFMANHTGAVETEDGEVTESFSYAKIAELTTEQVLGFVKEQPLELPLIAPKNVSDLGDPTSEIQKVKGNPRARRIRERELQTTGEPEASKTEPKAKARGK